MTILPGVVTYRNKTYKIDPNTVPKLQDGGLKREVSKNFILQKIN